MNYIKYAFLFLLMCTFTSFAQQPITASRAWAASYAAVEAELDNPQLMGAATFSGNYQIPDFGDVNMKFDLDDGTGTIWGFMYSGQKDGQDTTVSYIVAQILIVPLAIPVDIATLLPPEFVGFIAGEIETEWSDSPELATKLKSNSTCSLYLKENNNPSPDAVVLSDVEVSIAPFTGTVWQAVWIGTGSNGMTCYMHAETNETYCEALSVGVDYSIADDVNLSPNPTQDVVVVRGDVENLQRCYVINTAGSIVAEVSESMLQNIDFGIGIPVHSLSSGMYFVVFESENGRALKPIEIQR